MPPTVNISVDIDAATSDPSGGDGIVKPVLIDPATLQLHEETVLEFTFAGTAPGARFTAFRYYNTSADWWDKGWFKAHGGPGVGADGYEFVFGSISADGQTMCITDRADNQVLYFYVVEWTQGGQTYVCDPKIKNTP